LHLRQKGPIQFLVFWGIPEQLQTEKTALRALQLLLFSKFHRLKNQIKHITKWKRKVFI